MERSWSANRWDTLVDGVPAGCGVLNCGGAARRTSRLPQTESVCGSSSRWESAILVLLHPVE